MTYQTGETFDLSYSTRVVSRYRAILRVDIEMRQGRHISFTNMELSRDISNSQYKGVIENAGIGTIDSIGKVFDIIEERHWLEICETNFKVKRDNFVFKFCKPLRKIIAWV